MDMDGRKLTRTQEALPTSPKVHSNEFDNSTATWERRIISVRERGLIPERVTKRARGPAIAVHALPLASGPHALPYDLVYRP